MVSALLFSLAMVVSFLLFGSLGIGLGQKLEKKGVGEGLAPGCGIVLGVGGALVTMWILSALVKS